MPLLFRKPVALSQNEIARYTAAPCERGIEKNEPVAAVYEFRDLFAVYYKERLENPWRKVAKILFDRETLRSKKMNVPWMISHLA